MRQTNFPQTNNFRVNASIALSTVLFAGAIMLASGIAIMYNVIGITQATKEYVSQSFLEGKIDSCLEESLLRITRSPTFTGTFAVNFTDGTCQSTISINQSIPSKRDLILVATYSGRTQTRTKVVDTASAPFTITNY